MYLFIATIFIAELIIALTFIACIVKADKFVLELNKNIIDNSPKIRIALLQFEEFVLTFAEKTASIFEFAKKKRNEYIFKFVKTIFIYLLLFLVKGKCRKTAKLCQGLVVLKELLDGVLA